MKAIASVADNVPVVVLAPSDALFDKTLSNVQEVLARGGKVMMISDRDRHLRSLAPQSGERVRVRGTLLYAIPVQLLA